MCVCRKDNTVVTNIEEFKQNNVLIGPEGGLSEKDIESLSKNNDVTFISLGEKILRLETASLLALGVVMLKMSKKK